MMIKTYQFDSDKNSLIIQSCNIIELINNTSQYFTELLEEKNVKIFRTLGVVSGLTITIILI